MSHHDFETTSNQQLPLRANSFIATLLAMKNPGKS
jgi:hypothetical protein